MNFGKNLNFFLVGRNIFVISFCVTVNSQMNYPPYSTGYTQNPTEYSDPTEFARYSGEASMRTEIEEGPTEIEEYGSETEENPAEEEDLAETFENPEVQEKPNVENFFKEKPYEIKGICDSLFKNIEKNHPFCRENRDFKKHLCQIADNLINNKSIADIKHKQCKSKKVYETPFLNKYITVLSLVCKGVNTGEFFHLIAAEMPNSFYVTYNAGNGKHVISHSIVNFNFSVKYFNWILPPQEMEENKEIRLQSYAEKSQYEIDKDDANTILANYNYNLK